MSGYAVDRKKWASLSVFDQMGNIGSEVGRSLAAKRREDNQSAQDAMIRALDLFDATTDAWLVASPTRTKELLRAREQYLEDYFDPSGDNGIENYFMQFAVASRLSR